MLSNKARQAWNVRKPIQASLYPTQSRRTCRTGRAFHPLLQVCVYAQQSDDHTDNIPDRRSRGSTTLHPATGKRYVPGTEQTRRAKSPRAWIKACDCRPLGKRCCRRSKDEEGAKNLGLAGSGILRLPKFGRPRFKWSPISPTLLFVCLWFAHDSNVLSPTRPEADQT